MSKKEESTYEKSLKLLGIDDAMLEAKIKDEGPTIYTYINAVLLGMAAVLGIVFLVLMNL